MLYIKKNNRTPHIFLDAKSRFENYDDIPSEVKKELKNYLINEQGGLCAYCMARISEKESTIEHYIPRNGDNADPTLAIEYKNLLAVLRRCLDRLVSKDPKTPYAGIIIFELNNRLQRT